MLCRVTFGPEFISPGLWRRLSSVYREKASYVRKVLRDMFKRAYPAANITADGLSEFLITLAGLDYLETGASEYQLITLRQPWSPPPFSCPAAARLDIPQASLLNNVRLDDLMHNVACPLCGS